MPVLSIDLDPKGAQAGAAQVERAFDQVITKSQAVADKSQSAFAAMGQSIQQAAAQAESFRTKSNELVNALRRVQEAQEHERRAVFASMSVQQQKIVIQQQALQGTISLTDATRKMAEAEIFARTGSRALAQQMAATQAEYRKNEQAIRAMEKAQDAAGGKAHALRNALSFLSTGVAALGIVTSMTALVALLGSAVQEGLRYNATLEQQRIGIGSIVAATTQIRDAQGRVLEGAEKFNAAQKISSGLMKQIQQDALRTTATTEQLVDAFQSGIGPLTAAGLSLNQSREATIRIVQAASALGIPMHQVAQEVRAIAEGSIDVNARLAKTLGITNDQVARMKEQGKLYEFIVEKTESFAQAGRATEQSFFGLSSSLADVTQQLLGLAAAPLFDGMKASMQQMLNLLLAIRSKFDEDKESALEKQLKIAAQRTFELRQHIDYIRDHPVEFEGVQDAVIARTNKNLAEQEQRLKELQVEWGLQQSAAGGATKALDDYTVSAEASRRAAEELAAAQKKATESLTSDNATLRLKAQVLEQAKIKGETYAAAMLQVAKAVNVMKAGSTAAAEENAKLQKIYDDLVKGFKDAETAANKNAKEQDKLATATGKATEKASAQLAFLKAQIDINEQVMAGTLSLAEAEERKSAAQKLSATAADASKAAARAQAEEEAHLEAVIRSQTEAIQENTRRFQERQQQFKQMIDQQSRALEQFETDLRVLQLEVDLKAKVTAGDLKLAEAERQLAIAHKEAQLRSQGAVDGMRGLNDTVRDMATEMVDAERRIQDMDRALKDAALTTYDLRDAFREVAIGALQGTGDLFDAAERLGHGLGIKLIEGIAFGKEGLENKVLIPNFSSVFGPNGIVGGILSGSGFDLGTKFLSSFIGGSGGLFGGSGSGLPFTYAPVPSNLSNFTWTTGQPTAPPGIAWGTGLSGAFGLGNAFFGGGSTGSRIGSGLGGAFALGASGLLGGALQGALLAIPGAQLLAPLMPFIGSFLGDLLGGLFKPGRIQLEKKGIDAFFEQTFNQKFKILPEPKVAAGLDFFDQAQPSSLALGALYAAQQKDGNQGTIVRFGGQFLGNLKEQGVSAEDAKQKMLQLAQAIGGDLASAIKTINDMTASGGILSLQEFAEEIEESRKNLAKYGDTTNLTVRQLNDLALANGNTGSFLVSLNDLYAGVIDVASGFNEKINASAIANDLLASKFEKVAGGASAFEGAVGGIAEQIRTGNLTIEEAAQQYNKMAAAAGKATLTLKDFTLDPERIQKELAFITASFEQAAQATQGLGQLLGSGIMNGLDGLGANVEAFFQNLFGQQVLGAFLQKTMESLKMEDTLAPIFEQVLRAQDAFATGDLDQAGFQDRMQEILSGANPEIEKIKAGLLSAGEAGRALLDALGLLPDSATSAANAIAKISMPEVEVGFLQQSLDRARAAKLEVQAQLDAELNKGYYGSVTLIRNLRKQLTEANFGDVLAEDLTGGMADGFQKGMEQLTLEARLLPLVKQIQKQMEEATNDALADNVLTAQEQADIANIGVQGAQAIKAQADALEPTLQSVDRAAQAIRDGTSVSAKDFQDIQLAAQETEKHARAVDDALSEATEKLEEASLGKPLDEAEQIRNFLVEAAAALNTASLSPTAPTPFATGGLVGGSGSGDVVPALLDPREFVVNPAAAQKNFALLAYLNSGGELRRMQAGGSLNFGEAPSIRDQLIGNRVDTSSLAGLLAAISKLERTLATPASSAQAKAATSLLAELKQQLQQQLAGILDPIKAFIGETSDPVARVHEEFERLKKSLLDNRSSLEKASVDVDKYLAQLGSALPNRIREAVEQSLSQVVAASQGIGADLQRLLFSSENPASAFEKQEAARLEVARLEEQYKLATGNEKGKVAQDLSQALQQLLSLSTADPASAAYRSLFQQITGRLSGLKGDLDKDIEDAYEKAGLSLTGGRTTQVNNITHGDTKVEVNAPITIQHAGPMSGKEINGETAEAIEDILLVSLRKGRARRFLDEEWSK